MVKRLIDAPHIVLAKKFNAHMHTRGGDKHSLGRWGEGEGRRGRRTSPSSLYTRGRKIHARVEEKQQPSRTELKHVRTRRELKKEMYTTALQTMAATKAGMTTMCIASWQNEIKVDAFITSSFA